MKIMSDLESGSDEARRMLRAAVFLVNKGLKDKVFAVSMASHYSLASDRRFKPTFRCSLLLPAYVARREEVMSSQVCVCSPVGRGGSSLLSLNISGGEELGTSVSGPWCFPGGTPVRTRTVVPPPPDRTRTGDRDTPQTWPRHTMNRLCRRRYGSCSHIGGLSYW